MQDYENKRIISASHMDGDDYAAQGKKGKLPDHLVQFGDEWAIWRTIGLRGAGFPATYVLRLADTECASAADHIIRAEEVLEKQKGLALDALHKMQKQVNEGRRSSLTKLIRKITSLQQPQPFPETSIDCNELQHFQALYIAQNTLITDFLRLFSAATKHTSEAIAEIARMDSFREAIVWQNRRALHTAIDPYLRHFTEGTQPSQQRQHQTLIANYIQRYCVKNDTIGFFGPMGWAYLVPRTQKMFSLEPGAHLLAAHTVYFETWCIDKVLESIRMEDTLLPWVAPLRMPHIHVDGLKLYLPFVSPLTLSQEQAAVLLACDGEKTAQEIAIRLIQDTTSGLHCEEEVYVLLKELVTMRRITWLLEISPEGQYPEQAARAILERIEDEELRSKQFAVLNELVQVKRVIAEAAGNANELDKAFDGLETTFVRLTQVAPTRASGETYGARTLVYEDCRRDLTVELGPELIQALQQPLSLLLASARWLTYHLAELYRKIFVTIYSQLAQKSTSPAVDFVNFWLLVQKYIFDDDTQVMNSLVPRFQQKWASILAIPYEKHHLHYTSEALWPSVQKVFDVPEPGWLGARYHSPDILLQAASPEAIQAGNYQFVLGEIHLAINTLLISLFQQQYPTPGAFLDYAAVDIPEPRLLPVLPRYFPNLSARLNPIAATNKDWRLEFAVNARAPSRSKIIPIGSLLIEPSHGRLLVRTRDRKIQFDVIEPFAEFLTYHIGNRFMLFRPQAHIPRVTIDRLVVQRESWHFAPTDINFAQEDDAARLFLAARRWAQTQQMPRFVFVKVASEQKPCYVDFDSPVYVHTLAKLIRQETRKNAASLTVAVSEMLPGPDQLWLHDAQGSHYTSEFRFVLLDGRTPK